MSTYKTAKTKTGNSKKIMANSIEVDGRINTGTPTSLEQIWGNDGSFRYGTTNIEEYEKFLNEMMFVDMQNHARDIGLRPDVEPKILRERLLQEFARYISAFNASAVKVSKTPPKNKLSKLAYTALREGA